MLCEELENRIPDYLEDRLSPAQREEVQAHLAGCAQCRTLAQQLHQLDAALSAEIRIPELSIDFEQRLRARIQAAPAVLSEAQRAERRRQLQAEFEAGQARMRRRLFSLGGLLEHLTLPVLAGVVGAIVWLLTAQLTAGLNAKSIVGLSPTLCFWLIASVVFLAVGLAEAFAQRSKQI
jgi:anti-sigma factor RsiW